jgi:hypothetical protein
MSRGSTALILTVTLFPYRFRTTAPTVAYYAPDRLLVDFIANAVLFIPFGFGLASRLAELRVPRGPLAFGVVAAGLGLSLGVEMLQQMLATRHPMLLDVVANTLGSSVGLLAHRHVGVGRFGRALRPATWLAPVPALPLTLLAICAVVGCLLPAVVLRWATGFGNWDDSYPLLLGNEFTGDRPWRGSIRRIVITDQALTEAAVETLRRTPSRTGRVPPMLTFNREEGPPELSGRSDPMPDLVWAGDASGVQSYGPANLTGDAWLLTSEPPVALVRRLRLTREFTLTVEGATADPAQRGPARIVSLSSGPRRRNFTLSQDGGSLVVWLRTPFSGENGMPPEVRIPQVFATTHPRHLAVAYRNGSLSVFVDGARRGPPLPVTPSGSSLVVGFLTSRLYGKAWAGPFGSPEGWDRRAAAYYAALFLPLGLLLGASLSVSRFSRHVSVIILGAGLILPPLALELVLGGLSAHPASFANVLRGTSLVGVATLVLWPTTAPPSPRGHSANVRESDAAPPAQPG